LETSPKLVKIVFSITVLEEAGEEIKIKPPIHLQLQCKKEGA
jgi:hypothetical protein